MKTEIANIDDLKKNLQALVKTFSSRQVLLLNGPMGVGKTQIVKCLGEIYGLPEASSPSFALHNEYQNEKIRIDHLDLYRLESEED
ncbi:MAG: tRNA (adenosine(37)-N6)-threonylcarbamoyltransferase complex ATPase subunit type 1 TsaE, partial [Bdellovibrionales bacterium]|nr:tRNA (adenosine(37)-N6)-threonylcarbamoyltransferase complex ATPase subunit type 1 TsaE [Bdellovibrionales bacterium]